MTINFIPAAFHDETGECPVCIARVKLDGLIESERDLLLALSKALEAGRFCAEDQNGWAGSEETPALALTWSAFAQMLADYRVAFGINLAIWFSAERFGRASKVPDLLMAYEEYRLQSLSSFEQFDRTCTNLLALLDRRQGGEALSESVGMLTRTHKALMESVSVFWIVVDDWTVKRREQAFSVL